MGVMYYLLEGGCVEANLRMRQMRQMSLRFLMTDRGPARRMKRDQRDQHHVRVRSVEALVHICE